MSSRLIARSIAKSIQVGTDKNQDCHVASAPRKDSIGHLEQSERSQSYEILRLLTRSRKTDTLTLTSSARAPQNDKYRNAERVSTSQTDTVFSRFTSHFSRNANPSQPSLVKGRSKCAFTLAEVLITLGIIGVVAALTLPSVINNYKKQVTVAKLQKAYSVINQAFKQSEVDNESSEYWDDSFVTGSQPYFEKYYKPYLKGAKQCFSYQECGYNSKTPFKYKNGTPCVTSMDRSLLKKYRFAFYLPDGTFYWFLTASGAESFVPDKIIYIDINEQKNLILLAKIYLFSKDLQEKVFYLMATSTQKIQLIQTVAKDLVSSVPQK